MHTNQSDQNNKAVIHHSGDALRPYILIFKHNINYSCWLPDECEINDIKNDTLCLCWVQIKTLFLAKATLQMVQSGTLPWRPILLLWRRSLSRQIMPTHKNVVTLSQRISALQTLWCCYLGHAVHSTATWGSSVMFCKQI